MATVATHIGATTPHVRRAHDQRVLASRRDYVVAYVLSLATAACGLVAFRLASTQFGAAGFAEYAVTRRTLGFLVPLMSLGVCVALPRRVAKGLAGEGEPADSDLAAGSALIAGLALLGLAALMIAAPGTIALLCIGATDRVDLAWAMLPLAGGLVLAGFAAAYCRGRMWCGASHGIQLACVGVVPNMVLATTSDVRSFLLLAGAGVALVGGAALVAVNQAAGGAKPTVQGALTSGLSVLREGAPRTPGDLAFYGLLAAPAIVAAQRSGLAAGGDVAYGLALLMLIQQLVAPLAALLLPEAAYLLHVGQVQFLKQRLVRQLAASLAVTALFAMACFAWTEPLVELHLGSCTSSLAATVRWTALAAVPLRLFMCLRNVVDAGDARAICPQMCIAALGLFGAIVWLTPEATSSPTRIVAAFLAAITALCLATLWQAIVLLRKHRPAIATTP
jgi:O-antigen/teichoic acid export membrane protein